MEITDKQLMEKVQELWEQDGHSGNAYKTRHIARLHAYELKAEAALRAEHDKGY